MPTFLFAGKDVEGKKRHERVDADNAQAAKVILASRGWTDLELLIDELCYSEATKVTSTREDDPEIEAKVNTPEAQASFHNRGWKTSILGQTVDSVIESWKLALLSAALLAWGVYGHKWIAGILGALGLAFAVLFTPVFHLLIRLLGQTKGEYARLNRAKVWGRWNEVLECVERLQKPDRMTGSKIPELELIKSRASALAALGHLDDGLAEFQKLESSPKVEQWMYLSFLAGIYDSAKQFEKGLDLRRQAAALKPESAIVWTDVAYSCVRHLDHTTEAREALTRAERLESNPVGRAYLPFVRGMILWREHNPADAKEQLGKALVAIQPFAHNPLTEGSILSMKAFLCAASADLGETATAQALLREVEPFLVAHKETDLLAACRSSNTLVTA
jgi:tetratricopeptide (TPR) repeat protein